MKNFTIEIKWAFIFFIASLAWMFLEKSVGLHDQYIEKHPIYTNLFAIVAIAIYYFALRDKKKNFFNNQMTWKQGFVSGVYLSFFIAILSPLAQYVTSTIITPDYFKNVIAYAVEHNKMKREDAEMYFNLKSYIMQGIFGALSMGVVTSGIVAYFIKSK
ncbi:hypothetical protein FLJC2902T_12570 [Flavobacterium limnosediminis JC2902]|uniref:DUF4199 domain-containing protein n=1 Tax=Flavobacterium limnosediminis JC2902 TaxID=1341181 RepID=V6SPY2_9FLAO|nr:DUF4199 domain-containing protein [Flavobacterium limnosediminis]ESU28666.1 hypothetical protein FLJC2902T_12570 [Flavobacterium limnosediminis JC2902]